MAITALRFRCSKHHSQEVTIVTRGDYSDLYKQLAELGWWTNRFKTRCPACVAARALSLQPVQEQEIQDEHRTVEEETVPAAQGDSDRKDGGTMPEVRLDQQTGVPPSLPAELDSCEAEPICADTKI